MGKKIISNRLDLTKRLQEAANQIYPNLTSQKESMQTIYIALGKKDANEAISQFPQLLNDKLEQEIERQMVLIGPHRDDVHIIT